MVDVVHTQPHAPEHSQAAVRRLRPWVGIAHDDAWDWLRQNRGVTAQEYGAWVAAEYEPRILTGIGYLRGGALVPRPLTQVQREILDDVHTGLMEAGRSVFADPVALVPRGDGPQ
jgi:hypothetical protein